MSPSTSNAPGRSIRNEELTLPATSFWRRLLWNALPSGWRQGVFVPAAHADAFRPFRELLPAAAEHDGDAPPVRPLFRGDVDVRLHALQRALAPRDMGALFAMARDAMALADEILVARLEIVARARAVE